MTSRQISAIAWWRDMALACGGAFVICGLAIWLGLGNGATPAQGVSTTAEAPLNCRVTGFVGQDGNTASAVVNHLAGRRAGEALRIMQSDEGDTLDVVHPGQILSVPVPC